MFEYAKELGVECHLGVFVDEYVEENGKAGIIVKGEKFEADLLIAAVRSFRRSFRTVSKARGESWSSAYLISLAAVDMQFTGHFFHHNQSWKTQLRRI
jgi:hypothetical protein